MGLDQSIYRQKRDVYDEIANLKRELRSRDDEFYQSHSKEVDELSAKINALYQSGNSGDEVDWNEINKIREDFQAKYPDFFNKKIELEKKVEELSGDKEEMSYFTDWSFHQYLSKLYGEDIENLTIRVIDKDGFQKILSGIGKDYQPNDDYTVQRDIEDIVENYDDEYVYYYYAWW